MPALCLQLELDLVHQSVVGDVWKLVLVLILALVMVLDLKMEPVVDSELVLGLDPELERVRK